MDYRVRAIVDGRPLSSAPEVPRAALRHPPCLGILAQFHAQWTMRGLCPHTFIGQLLDMGWRASGNLLMLLALPRGLEPLFSPERAPDLTHIG
jgi:hypothetical protein